MLLKTLAWWDSDNFGDALNPYIFRAFGVKVSYQQANVADFLALGSVLERIFIGAHTRHETYFSPEPIEVWGSGVHFDVGRHIEQPHIKIPEKFIRDVNFRAVRGKITKQRVEAILGRPLPEDLALGDPGLLMNRIVKGSRTKKYKLGIVPHFHDAGSHLFKDIQKRIPGSIIINVKSDPVAFIKEMTCCDAVISTAMHPLIVADSYGIPNLWITTANDKISSYKYQDYYSIYDINPVTAFDIGEKIFTLEDVEKLIETYAITKEQVFSLQEKLIESFPVSQKNKENFGYLSLLDKVQLRWHVINRDSGDAGYLEKLLRLLKYHLKLILRQ
ncbi:MAG: polysaccharide pyruvyl transferase family protein [Emcibacter sp.]|nr:polysaccharide pyruvyl transferase family protein [Emcibacter sp.]